MSGGNVKSHEREGKEKKGLAAERQWWYAMGVEVRREEVAWSFGLDALELRRVVQERAALPHRQLGSSLTCESGRMQLWLVLAERLVGNSNCIPGAR
jgi:hypothetical protein